MADLAPVLLQAIRGIAEALLIGFLVGAQREASHGERHAGVRDFVLIAVVGAVCGLLQSPWLTVAALISITLLLGVFYFHIAERSGITTEMAAVATFCLAYLASVPDNPVGEILAIGIAVVVAAFLEAKRSLHKFVRETITETEFNDTLRFLAVIFIIYPLLPERGFGPYQALSPRAIWVFVILVSSISYVGYFFEKFLGARRGLKFAGFFGGLASTTATTMSFARSCCEEPGKLAIYGQAAVIANSMQFPRVLLILLVVNPALARASMAPLLAAGATGLLLGLVMARAKARGPDPLDVALGNPFRLLPALKFGAVFAAILFASKTTAVLFGSGALYWTSAIGGSVNVDAVAVTVSDLLSRGVTAPPVGLLGVYLALMANAVVKGVLAAYIGTTPFAVRVFGGFVAMFGAGFLAWVITSGI